MIPNLDFKVIQQDTTIVTMTDIWSINWYHFQLPGITPNPEFKVMPSFDTKYLGNNNR